MAPIRADSRFVSNPEHSSEVFPRRSNVQRGDELCDERILERGRVFLAVDDDSVGRCVAIGSVPRSIQTPQRLAYAFNTPSRIASRLASVTPELSAPSM